MTVEAEPRVSRARAGSARAGRLVAVASGKGGVGKTWFSITLAHALARCGERVLLFDGDLGLANVDIQLGLWPEHDLGEMVAGRGDLAGTAHPFAEGGFDIVAGRSGSGALSALSAVALEGVVAELRAACGRYDSVVLDLGAGLERTVRRLAAAADMLLVVATDEPTSLTDAYAVLKLYGTDCAGCGRGRGDARVVINQAPTRAAGERTFAALARACASFLGSSPVLAGVVRRDARVRDAIRSQLPLLTCHPNSPAAEDVEQVARGITERAGD